eukprot:TRINITY_DN5453_c0_g1_i1.p1 TRINITY_DN5453_c0_g1~~TRINITY_DN5453_c0_g1_i1.p1  ORF type:complete len:138 (-),score=16.58 TRINITY_DN5453_c0_g1_i1:138-551(-)
MNKESATEFVNLWTIQIKSISEMPQTPAHVSLDSCGIHQVVLAKSAAMASMILVLRMKQLVDVQGQPHSRVLQDTAFPIAEMILYLIKESSTLIHTGANVQTTLFGMKRTQFVPVKMVSLRTEANVRCQQLLPSLFQ